MAAQLAGTLRKVRSMIRWLLLGGAIVSEVTGSLSLKGALSNPLLYLPVAVGFVAAFVLLSAVLRAGMHLGVAYGVWAACGVALTAVMSSVIYGEPFTLLMGVGVVLIVAGVLLVEMGSHPGSRVLGRTGTGAAGEGTA